MGVEVLGLYDLARCHAAIDAVERRDKPVAEVAITVPMAYLGQLIDESVSVAARAKTGEIRIHIDYREGVALVAFYRHEWCRAALRFVNGGGCPPPERPWLEGLVYGYAPSAIQRYVETIESRGSAST